MFGKEGNEEKEKRDEIIVNKKNEEMTEEEAFKKIKDWADHWYCRLRGDDYLDLRDAIWLVVKKEKLIFNYDRNVFEYVLLDPIKDVNTGQTVISKIIIKSSAMKDKNFARENRSRNRDRGDTINSSEEDLKFMKIYCKQDDGDDIAEGFLMRIMDRDQVIISAVILGFFLQAAPRL